MRILVLILGVVVGGLAAANGQAATVRNLQIDQDGEAYRVSFEAVVALAPDRVFALLTDYDHLERLHPGIVEAERLGREGEAANQVRTVLKACVAFFCRELSRVEEIESSDQRLIRARILPESSDFRAGKSHWELAAVAEGTRIRFRSRMVPDFWVPMGIGPWAVKRAMGEQLRGLVRRMEQLEDGAARVVDFGPRVARLKSPTRGANQVGFPPRRF